MAIKDVEGSDNTKELTGPDLLKYLMERFNMSRTQAIESMLKHGHSPNKKKKGGSVRRKKGGTASRRGGRKIMVGYIAGGKV